MFQCHFVAITSVLAEITKLIIQVKKSQLNMVDYVCMHCAYNKSPLTRRLVIRAVLQPEFLNVGVKN